jgi:hypothetical protein
MVGADTLEAFSAPFFASNREVAYTNVFPTFRSIIMLHERGKRFIDQNKKHHT